MKQIVCHINSLLVILLLTLSSCNSQKIGESQEELHGEITIAHLKTHLKGNSSRINEDISVCGYVIANDLYAELNKEIVIADQSGAIAIAVDVSNTAVKFPIYARITISCSGLQIGQTNGRPTLGSQSEQGYRVERLSSDQINRHILIDKKNAQPIEPQVVSIKDITPQTTGNFVRIDNVTFGDDSGKEWCEKDRSNGEYLETIRNVQDLDGNVIGIYISGECSYHNEIIPSDKGSICGIVEMHNQRPTIRIIQYMIDFRE